jgi:hypothetical protein
VGGVILYCVNEPLADVVRVSVKRIPVGIPRPLYGSAHGIIPVIIIERLGFFDELRGIEESFLNPLQQNTVKGIYKSKWIGL